ncbi:MAG: hypothetical protein M3008_06085 [Chloroflexota bacterium]|nr:hypothetical protein [Chloroflexota bacterium]
MPERDAIDINLGDGAFLTAAGVRRERSGDLTADLILRAGDKIIFSDRAVLNTPEGRDAWAAKATGPDRPDASRLAGAIAEYLLPDALAQLQHAPKKPSEADELVGMVVTGATADLAAEAAELLELFHNPDGAGYATFQVGDHRETRPLRSRQFKLWLTKLSYEQRRKTPRTQALNDALAMLEARARFDGQEYPVHVRLAEQDGNIYLDLCNERWEVVEVDDHGWRVLTVSPVKFVRTKKMLALPVPIEGGSIAALRPFVNVGGDADFVLVVAWLIGALRPRGPYAILILHGEQGSAKSTTARILRSLVDPNGAPIRTAPRDERDLLIAATNNWAVCFDNLSHLPPWLSDALCRIATGGGLATRELYSDQEETILDAQRPQIVNGIEELATRGDLLDRAIILYLPTIPERERRTEAAVWRAFDEAQPAILGALLDLVSAGLRNLPDTHLDRLPRLADFALWCTAALKGADLCPDTDSQYDFAAAYEANRAAANDLTLEASVVAQAVRAFMASKQEWEGTATELLTALEATDSELHWRKGWPKDGHALSGALRRLAPSLRLAKIAATIGIREGHEGRRLIKIEKVG